ncbi:hypothetical protein DV738_g4297, partial [Chaetothyriales sp. CBS 135597]
MGKKRKTRPADRSHEIVDTTDHFPESEDEFFASKDQVLVDDGPTAKRQRRLAQEMQELQPSDEEVLSAGSAPGVDDDADGDEYWGPSTSDYYNADAIENEEDALAEEAEARRLRQKQLKRMTDADFGFDELHWKADDTPEDHPSKARVVENLPPFKIPEDATDEERRDIIRARYPEFEPLSQNLLRVHTLYRGYLEDPTQSKIIKLKIRASLAYMAAVIMYISILTHTKNGLPLPPSELREHPIIGTLLRCQQAWEGVKDMEDVEDGPPESSAINDHTDLIVTTQPKTSDKKKGKTKQKAPPEVNARHSKWSEMDDLDSLAPIPTNIILGDSNPAKKTARSKPIDIADLFAQANSKLEEDSHVDFGDEDPLVGEAAAEKSRKKSSLRFYSSQIAQKANARKRASHLAGGDDDLPYKEHRRDKETRLARESGKKASTSGQQDSFDSDSEGGAAPPAQDEAHKYYDSIVSAAEQKKSEKRARANAQAEAARQGAQVFEEEQVGPDGKRKITYAIQKNKGLAPKRKKEVRNPRVKKKMRYEQKMKKLGSIRVLYKGGEAKGGYGGELTGIKTNLVKSIKL